MQPKEAPVVLPGGDVVSVLFAALIGGFALGQAAPNLQYFATGRVAGARVLGMIKRCLVWLAMLLSTLQHRRICCCS